MNATSAGPGHVLLAGHVYDLPKEIAQRMLKSRLPQSRQGDEHFAATLVVDPRVRARAERFAPLQNTGPDASEEEE